MNEFHHKNEQCEQCGQPIQQVGLLQAIHFWLQKNDRLIPYYLYVCDNCYTSKESWCKHIFPEQCQRCNAPIEDGEHFLAKTLNQLGENIQSYGLPKGEHCDIICVDCKNEMRI